MQCLTGHRNYGRGLVAGACVGILAAMLIIFVVVHFVIVLRKWLTETKLGMHGRFSKMDVHRVDHRNGRGSDIEMLAAVPKGSRSG